MAQLVKYGTEDNKEIWMLRYGFTFEDIEWLEPYIKTINEEEIIFNKEINELSDEKINVIKGSDWNKAASEETALYTRLGLFCQI